MSIGPHAINISWLFRVATIQIILLVCLIHYRNFKTQTDMAHIYSFRWFFPGLKESPCPGLYSALEPVLCCRCPGNGQFLEGRFRHSSTVPSTELKATEAETVLKTELLPKYLGHLAVESMQFWVCGGGVSCI